MMRDKKPLSLIMLGFDREDRNLPPSEVSLKHLAGILKASIHRGGDLAIRYDHTKFGLLLIGTDTRDASRIAEALRPRIFAAS
jgi:hypothetical protein